MTDNLLNDDDLNTMLTQYGQQHVLQHWSHLNSEEQSNLKAQLSGIDLAELASLINGQDEDTDFGALASRASSPPAVRTDGSGAGWSPAQARESGERALRNGELGAVIVAGGQGTRWVGVRGDGQATHGNPSKR